MKDKTAIVTGGTKGIGRAVAEALLKTGMNVFVGARKKAEVEKAVKQMSALGAVGGAACDVQDEKQVADLFKKCVKEFGGVDVLVNNAGVGFIGKTVEEMSVREFEQTLKTNLFGVFYCCKNALPLMKRRGGGYIINISSLAGQNAHPRMAAYNASKFALNGFSEALMQETRADNIKVTTIAPGSVNTYFGGDAPSEDQAWQIQPEDIGQLVIDLLEFDPRALPSKIEIRPAKPPQK